MERTSAATYYLQGVTDFKKQEEQVQRISKERSCLTAAHMHPYLVPCRPNFGCRFYRNGELLQ